MKTSGRVVYCTVLLGFVLAGASVEACSVPVYRYGLECWPVEPYELYVFHRGTLGRDQKRIVDWLDECSFDMDVSNVELFKVNLDAKVEPAAQEVWKKQKDAELPWLVLRYPGFYEAPGHIWAGPMTADAAKALLDSPARRKVGKRILKGDVAVWVLLESGDRKKDDAAAKVIKDELRKMEASLELPEMLDYDLVEGAEEEIEDVKIKFSLVRLSRTDPAERVFVGMLLGSEADLKTFSEPMVFPVFAKGRALSALVGKGINGENIRDIGAFLVGPCACTVKEANPGVDLLMSVNWGALPEGRWVRPPQMPPLTGISAFAEGGAEPGSRRFLGFGEGGGLVRNILIVAALAVLVVAVTTAIIRRRRKLKGD